MAFSTRLIPRAFSSTPSKLAIKHVTVIGGGLMGSGIAQVAAQTGHNVTIVDVSEDVLNKTQASIQKSLGRVAKKKFADDKEGGDKFMSETMGRLSTNTDAVKVAEGTDLVIEAIVENIGIKQKLFKALDDAAPRSGPTYLRMAAKSAANHHHMLLQANQMHFNQQMRYYSTRDDGENSDGSSSDEDNDKLKLSKPGRLKKKLREERLKNEDTLRDLENDLLNKMEPGTTAAAKNVAESLGGNTEEIQSDLLSKLREHSLKTSPSQASGKGLKDIFSGIKVESRVRGGGKQGKRMGRRRGKDDESKLQETSGIKHAKEFTDRLKEKRSKRQTSQRADVKLFEGPALDIFKSQTQKAVAERSLFDVIQKEELDKLTSVPATNRFEEQIEWAEKGIGWKFPLNNEHGLEHEQNIPFYEHVFLEPLLEDGFPKKGPVRHFMELVCVGLSKNPYLTVQEKHDHIEWFKTYFKSKQKLMDELMEGSEAQQSLNTQ